MNKAAPEKRGETDETMRSWHALSVEEVVSALKASAAGLTTGEAERRAARVGPNELVARKKKPAWTLIVEQFRSFLLVILAVAAVVSGILAVMGEGDIWDPALILVIILFAAAFGCVQEYRSEQALEALQRMAAPTALVKRDGAPKEIPAREVVPGDVIVLQVGDRIPADARIIEQMNLKTDEAPLTGESVAVEKTLEAIPEDAQVADRTNMLYAGTTVIYGRGEAVVTATGMATEFGRIAGMLEAVERPPTPLQVSLDKAGRILGIACLGICAVVAGTGLAVGMFEGILGAFIWGVSLAVAAVPEALPAVVTIALAVGVQRMAKCHALVRHLPAVETLGCTTFICSDKTGTLTQNEMTVTKLYANGRFVEIDGVGYEPEGTYRVKDATIDPRQDTHIERLLVASALCNDARLQYVDGKWTIHGDPTEGALVVLAAKAGFKQEELDNRYPRINEVPFSSERKRMTTLHETPEATIAYSKGAPELILAQCTRIYANSDEQGFRKSEKEQILEESQTMAASGLRVLGLADKALARGESAETAEQDMVFLGLVGMIDPPRPEVRRAVEVCNQAGINSVMITGDHKLTAVSVAEELGLLDGQSVTLTGKQLDEISDEEFDRQVENVRLYSRVSPAHKMRVVEALQKKGHVVAMTGDGVNDAPALKRADIGVAMGITGTDVSKEAGAMVLTDDNFASIVAAVEEGRRIFDNIKKFLISLLASNSGEVLLMLIAFVITTLMGKPAIPLVALQILWVNLVTDGPPALALAVDPAAPNVMRRPPRRSKAGVFSRPVTIFIAGIGLWTALVTFGVFIWALQSGRALVEAQCLTFVTLVVVQLFHSLNCRSESLSLFTVGVFKNRWLLGGVASSLLLTLPLLYVPFLQGPFRTFALGLSDWGIVLLCGVSVIVVAELGKLVARRVAQSSNSNSPLVA